MTASRFEDWTRAELRALAGRAQVEMADASALDVLAWASATFGDAFAVASSMADGVMAHLAQRAAPGVDVIFLDTGYHFAETLGTRDALAGAYDVTVRTMLPVLTVAQQDLRHGLELWRRDPAACCAMRKVEPLNRALRPYAAWASGIRREETPQRSGAGVVEWDATRQKVKINPIAAWTQQDVDAYVEQHGVLRNPLLDDGYASVGCAPCTRRTSVGEDARAGRWAGSSKTECGLHT